MQRIRITNENPKSEVGTVVVTQLITANDATKSTVAANLEPQQSILLTVWPNSTLTLSEKLNTNAPASPHITSASLSAHSAASVTDKPAATVTSGGSVSSGTTWNPGATSSTVSSGGTVSAATSGVTSGASVSSGTTTS